MVGAILGLDPNTSRAEAMRRMVRAHQGMPSEFVGNIATQWGQTHEQEALEAFQYSESAWVAPATFVVDPDRPWLGASPDGYVWDDAVFECKCPFGLRDHDKPVPFKTLSDQPHYYAQMQIQMLVTGRKHCFFWQWTPHDENLTVVDFDQNWIDVNLPKLEQFYQEFLEICDDAVDERTRTDFDTPAIRQKLAEYDDLQREIAAAEDRRKEILIELVKIAGSKDATIYGRKLTKVEKAGSISYAAAIKVLAPDADLEKWRGKPSSYWLFK
jgi:putative phage-type endonuclease